MSKQPADIHSHSTHSHNLHRTGFSGHPAGAPHPFHSRQTHVAGNPSLGLTPLCVAQREAANLAAMVEFRVSECLREGHLELDLARMGLLEAPAGALSRVPWLHVLDVSGNELAGEALAALSRSALPALKCLSACGNLICGPLPASVGSLAPGLEELALDNNRLTSLPASMAGLRELQWLSLAGNALAPSLPGPLLAAWSGALRHLDLRGNQLTSLPPELGDCAALEALFLGDNQLEGLPETLGGAAALRLLSAPRNAIVELPTGLAGCAALRVLDLCENKLTVVPGEVLEPLRELRELLLSGNALVMLPEQVGACSALEVLAVANNQLSELPAALGALGALRELYAQGNKALAALPEAMGACTQLRTLSLRFCKIKGLPSCVIARARAHTHTHKHAHSHLFTHAHTPLRRGAAAWTELEHLDARGKAKNTLKVPEDLLIELKRKCKSLYSTMGGDPNDEANRAGLVGVTKAKKK